MEIKNYKTLKSEIQELFDNNDIGDYADIDWIMVEITGKTRSMLPFHSFSEDEITKIRLAVEKRIKHIPIAYIFGKSYFFGREFIVDENVLIPRQDTEILVQRLISDINDFQNKFGKKASVLDIGTGSGAIAITVQKETDTNVVACDISEGALAVAKSNAKKLGANVGFVHSDLFENVSGKFDFIVSNPPYIETTVIDGLSCEVRDYEPKLALDGGKDGLIYYRRIIDNAKSYLKLNGKLYFEIGYNQADSVSELMKTKFKDIEIIRDYDDNNRVVLGEILWLKD